MENEGCFKNTNFTIVTNRNEFEVKGLRRIWVNRDILSGAYNLFYQDSIYDYRLIYWSHDRDAIHDDKDRLIRLINEGYKTIRL